MQEGIHWTLEGCRGPRETEGHQDKLVKPGWCGKCGLLSQTWFKGDLPVALWEIKGDNEVSLLQVLE